MKSGEKLNPKAIVRMKEAICDAEGQEVLFVVRLDENGMGHEVVVASRGNDTAAPAIYPFMEKGDVVIHNHPSGVLKPSSNDLVVASRLGNQGIGFYIVNNNVTKVYCVTEAASGGRKKLLDKEKLCSILLPGGLLSKEFEYFETRDSQVEMLEGVIDAFNGNMINVTEAGTGVGKSFSYIIPAIEWAHTNKERVVISTATINLQQQLMDKDIPVISKITGLKIKSVLVKGRGNFICLRRLEDSIREMALFSEEEDELATLYKWSRITDTGSRSDLSFVPDKNLWNRVCSESDACMGMKCPMREKCFVLKLRKEAASAQILVVNHHLLFSDLAMRVNGAGFEGTAVLPPFNRVIFDEAHTIEKSATSFFSDNYNKFMLLRNLNTIYGKKKRVSYGLLEKIKLLITTPEELNDVPLQIRKVKNKMELLEQAAEIYLGGENSRRITQNEKSTELENFLSAFFELHSSVLKLIEIIKDGVGDLFAEIDDNSDVFELKVTLQRLQKLCGVLGSFQNIDERVDQIFWIEHARTGKRESFYSCYITPLDISEMMKSAVYDTQSTIIFTSATLTVQKKFEFWRRRVGLFIEGEDRLAFKSLKSPFEYRKQVLLAIPGDAPEPTQEQFQEFLSDTVLKIVSVSEGRALVLFTSYSMLKRTFMDVSTSLNSLGITVMKQGDDDRFRLLESFKNDISSVLFATDSFWEGVDVPGEALKLVVICKLPFRVPTDPIVKARMERIELMGGNPFFDLSLPEAAMRLKQGFGRLMRKKSDHGAVVILDPRIINKSYGRILLSSLPETVKSIKNTEDMLLDLENFLYM